MGWSVDSGTITSNTIGSVFAVVAGALLLKMAFSLKAAASPLDSPAVVVAILALYVTAFALMVLAIVPFDLAKHGGKVGYVVFGVVSLAFAAAYFTKYASVAIGTDAILFSHYAVDLLLQGQNPYTHSMLPAFGQYPVDERFVTYRQDGSVVTSFSYPALSILYFVPQEILGVANFNLTPVVVLLAVLLFLVSESPGYLALAPFLVLFADANITLFTYGGVFDILWVLPLLLGMKYWDQGRLPIAAFFVGISLAVKQTPWFIGPFLAIWLYLESDQYAEFANDALTCIGFGLLGFLLPNALFIIWNPMAWMQGVFTPIASGAPLVQQGSGAVLLSVSGLYPLPKTFFTTLLMMSLLVGAVVYSLYFDRLKWVAWVVPAFVLWFNYRSLQNYFIFFVPIAYYAMLLRLNLARHRYRRGEVADV